MTMRGAFIVLCACIMLVTCQLPDDPQRPVFHYLPEKNWMNDPNGLMYFNGFYHMFYQYNPWAPYNNGNDMSWGHAVSKDLVYWTYLPVALLPTPGSYDSNGVWSGSATIVNGVPTLVYTGVNSQGAGSGETVNTATPLDLTDPLLVNWTRTTSNPLIPNPPPGLSTTGFRDPTTAWRSADNSTWYIELGSGIAGQAAVTLLYKSTDFLHWEYVHPFYNATNSFGGSMFECPDFYQLDSAYVYKASAWFDNHRFDLWMVGQYDQVNQLFVPDTLKQGWFDFGVFYASKSLFDPVQNRRIVFGWAEEDDSESSSNARGWAGVQSLPRQVILNSDNTLSHLPIVDLQKLRGAEYSFTDLVVDDQEIPLKFQGDQLEILLSVESTDVVPSQFGLKIRASPDNEEYTLIYFVPPSPFMNNTDLPGLDYLGVVINASDPGLCNGMCVADEQCFCWAYAPPGDQGPTAMCFLKRFVPNQAPKVGTVSGIKGQVVVNRTHSSLASDANNELQIAPLSGAPQNLRIFVDHSVVEVFANDGRTNILSRIYPTLNSSNLVSVFAVGGQATVNITAYEIASIW